MSKLLHLINLLTKLNPKICQRFPSEAAPSKCGGLFTFQAIGTAWPLNAAHPKEIDFVLLAHAIKGDIIRREWDIQYCSRDADAGSEGCAHWAAEIECQPGFYRGWGADDIEAIALLEAYCRCLNYGGAGSGVMAPCIGGYSNAQK